MCGVAGIAVRKPANMEHIDFSKMSRELLFAIDDRGGHACGYVAVGSDGSWQEQKAACSALEFETEMYPMPPNLQTLLLHTRFATQGSKAFPANNHPVKSGPIRVIHNGMIMNDDNLFESTGIVRIGKVDSEAIAANIRHHGWENATKALEELDGSFAIAAVSEEHTGELLLAKGVGSPLVMAVRDNFIMWASTLSAITYAWKTCIGTTPSIKHIDWMKAGEWLKLSADNKVTTGEFTCITQPYTRWAGTGGYSSNYGRTTDDEGVTTTTYYMNGRRYRYDPSTGRQELLEDDADTDMCRTTGAWAEGWNNRPVQAAKSDFCCECGSVVLDDLEDLGGDTYCESCIEFLVEYAQDDAMPGAARVGRALVPYGVDDDPFHRRDISSIPNPLDQFVRCPDCYDNFQVADMVKDGGELVCHECAQLSSSLGMTRTRGI